MKRNCLIFMKWDELISDIQTIKECRRKDRWNNELSLLDDEDDPSFFKESMKDVKLDYRKILNKYEALIRKIVSNEFYESII